MIPYILWVYLDNAINSIFQAKVATKSGWSSHRNVLPNHSIRNLMQALCPSMLVVPASKKICGILRISWPAMECNMLDLVGKVNIAEGYDHKLMRSRDATRLDRKPHRNHCIRFRAHEQPSEWYRLYLHLFP